MWFDDPTPETIEDLGTRGAFVEISGQGEVTCIRFVGEIYNDFSVTRISSITGLHTLDIRETAISSRGADRLRKLMPNTIVLDE